MDIEIRAIDPDEFDAFARATERAFGAQAIPEEVDEWRRVFEPGRFFAALRRPGDRRRRRAVLHAS